MPRFKHVYFHRARNVWQAACRGKVSVTSSTEEGCAQAAAKLWKVSYASLVKQSPKQAAHLKVKQYKHISWHSSKGVWVVMDSHDYVGCHKELKGALGIATSHFKCSVKSLMLDKPRFTGDNSSDFCKRVALVYGIYKGALPLDLQDLISNAKRSKRVPPSLLLPYVLCKFPSHRQAVFDVMAKLPRGSDYALMCGLVVRIASLSLPGAWVRSIGRKNMHHGTFVMFARGELRLISKAKVAKRGEHVLKIGKCQAKYSISKLTPKLREQLSCIRLFGEEVQRIKAPRTVKDWVACSDKLCKIAAKTPGLSATYRKLWAIRCCLIMKMRQAGVASLKLSDETVRDFQNIVPDQKQLMTKAAGGSFMLHRKMRDVFCDCSYRGPPELFSMWACLVSDRAVSSVSLEWLSEHEDQLRSCLSNLKAKDGATPHPGVLVEELKRQLK